MRELFNLVISLLGIYAGITFGRILHHAYLSNTTLTEQALRAAVVSGGIFAATMIYLSFAGRVKNPPPLTKLRFVPGALGLLAAIGFGGFLFYRGLSYGLKEELAIGLLLLSLCSYLIFRIVQKLKRQGGFSR